MRFLFISTLFPNSTNPTRALYNLRHLSAIRELGHEVDVIAPVPWFPGLSLLGRTYPPCQEDHAGFHVVHPRFLAPPGTMVHRHHWFYRKAVGPLLAAAVDADLGAWGPKGGEEAGEVQKAERRTAAGEPTTENGKLRPQARHVILGFVYPDAVAMGPVCEKLGLDYSVFVLGSDFRLRVNQPKFRDAVMEALRRAPRIFCPGQMLRNDMIAAGLDARCIHAFNNGVDAAVFHP